MHVSATVARGHRSFCDSVGRDVGNLEIDPVRHLLAGSLRHDGAPGGNLSKNSYRMPDHPGVIPFVLELQAVPDVAVRPHAVEDPQPGAVPELQLFVINWLRPPQCYIGVN